MTSLGQFDGFTLNGSVAEIHDDELYLTWMERADFIAAVVGDDDATVANRRLAMDFEVELAQLVARGTVHDEIDTVLAKFLADDYIQHDPPIGDGRDALAEWFRNGAAGPTPPPPIAITATGDLVSVVLQLPPGALGPDQGFLTTTYRVREGRLCEHWGMLALVVRALNLPPVA